MSNMFNDNSSYYASPMDVRKVTDDLKKYKEEVGTCLTSVHNQLIDARKQIDDLKLQISL
jgi:hypothetical protein